MRHPDRPPFPPSAVFELRQYTLRPGRRQSLVDVFEDHLVDGQEDCGMAIGSLCLDEADPDRFVWMRDFAGLDQRTQSLEGFYLGPVWSKHRDAANSTMLDSDDVLMLRPTEPAHPPAEPRDEPRDEPREEPRDEPREEPRDEPREEPRDDVVGQSDRIHLSVYTYAASSALDTHLSTDFHDELESLLGVPVATWRSHPGPKGFPQLPVRPDHAFVWAATFADADQRQQALERLHDSGLCDDLLNRTPPVAIQELNLRPTRRSRHPNPTSPPSVRS